jgi:hypothetical protein
MPVNWYAALVVIVILGLGSVAFARYNYSKTTPSTQPEVGVTWHAGLAFDICGTMEPALAASAQSSTNGLTTTGSGVLLISPKSSVDAGANATLGKFASEYTGLTLNNTTLKYPGASAAQYKNGGECGSATPDAGKKGVLEARSWVIGTAVGKNNQLKQTGGATTTKPKGLRLANRQLITVGFVPSGTQLPKPPGSTTTALLQAIEGTTAPVSTTTTTAAPVTPTTAAGATTTTAPVTTTTAPTTTTTAAPTTTTTVKSTTTTSKSKK